MPCDIYDTLVLFSEEHCEDEFEILKCDYSRISLLI